MIVMAVPIIAFILNDDQRMFQAERYDRLGRDIQSLAASHNLGTGAGARSGRGSNGCAFSSAGNGADDGSEHCASTDILASPAVLSDAFSSACVHNAAAFPNDGIMTPVHNHRLQIENV